MRGAPSASAALPLPPPPAAVAVAAGGAMCVVEMARSGRVGLDRRHS